MKIEVRVTHNQFLIAYMPLLAVWLTKAYVLWCKYCSFSPLAFHPSTHPSIH